MYRHEQSASATFPLDVLQGGGPLQTTMEIDWRSKNENAASCAANLEFIQKARARQNAKSISNGNS